MTHEQHVTILIALAEVLTAQAEHDLLTAIDGDELGSGLLEFYRSENPDTHDMLLHSATRRTLYSIVAGRSPEDLNNTSAAFQAKTLLMQQAQANRSQAMTRLYSACDTRLRRLLDEHGFESLAFQEAMQDLQHQVHQHPEFHSAIHALKQLAHPRENGPSQLKA